METLISNSITCSKIMAIGMGAVFGVLIIIYLMIKIMFKFAKKPVKKD